MSDLKSVQQAFQNYLIQDSDDISRYIKDSHSARSEHRLAVYHNAYHLRLVEALAINYPTLQKLLDEEQFDGLALGYIRQNPSAFRSIAWFGDHFADFLDKQEAISHAAFFAELARFDWSRNRVFDAADSESQLDISVMTRIAPESWPTLQFQFIPALRVEDLKWNAAEVAEANDRNQTPPEPMLLKEPVRWAIWRQNNGINWRSLPVHEAWALDQALQGENFAAICEGLLEWIPTDTAALTAASMIKQWIGDQWITKLHQKE